MKLWSGTSDAQGNKCGSTPHLLSFCDRGETHTVFARKPVCEEVMQKLYTPKIGLISTKHANIKEDYRFIAYL